MRKTVVIVGAGFSGTVLAVNLLRRGTAQGTDIVPIPGTTNPIRLEENLAAPRINLSKNELQRIEAAAPRGIVVGQRYHPSMMQLLNG